MCRYALLYMQNYLCWLVLENECINGMYGLGWHEHTGNEAESLAKSTTSGSSSNMLFSIMFLGRLARSTTHRGSEIRRIILKKGK